MTQESALIQDFFAAMPEDFLVKTLILLFNTYDSAYKDCYVKSYAFSEAHYIFPHRRRADFERDWRKLAKKYDGLTSNVKPNCIKNAFHTVVYSRNVGLTVSAVSTATSMVRRAVFRATYARDPQLSLFEEQTQIPDIDRYLYGILLHGPAQSKAPAFAQIAFPDPQCKTYVDRIDLYAKYRHILVERRPVEQVEEPDIKIRHRRESAGEDA